MADKRDPIKRKRPYRWNRQHAPVPTPVHVNQANVKRRAVYDPNIAEYVLDEVANGRSLTNICQEPGMPLPGTIISWITRDYHDFSIRYMHAMRSRAAVWMEQIIDIADDASQDIVEQPNGSLGYNLLHIKRCKLMIETRQWVGARILHEVYGNKTTSPIEEKKKPAPPTIIIQPVTTRALAETRDARESSPDDIEGVATEGGSGNGA